MESPVLTIWLMVGIIAILIPIVAMVSFSKRKETIRKRNAINNVIADLIDKRAISFVRYDYFDMKKNPDYRPVNKVEKAILEHGFEKSSAVNSKEFHLRLRKNLKDLRYAVDRTDSRLLDFETSPKTRVSNAGTSDTSAIIPFVAFGDMEAETSTYSNPKYTGDPDYNSSGSSGGGWSGGDSGGDGGGGSGD